MQTMGEIVFPLLCNKVINCQLATTYQLAVLLDYEQTTTRQLFYLTRYGFTHLFTDLKIMLAMVSCIMGGMMVATRHQHITLKQKTNMESYHQES